MTIAKIVAGTGAILLLAALWLRGEHYSARARSSETLLSSALAIGNANAALAEAQAHSYERIDALGRLHALRTRQLRRESDQRRKEIIDVPDEADGPLAPVLRDQLDRLPRRPCADPSCHLAAAGDPGGITAPD